MVRQIPGSEENVKRYFSEIKGDTIYVIMFPPGNCPRCEAQINALDYELKKAKKGIKTVLVSAYHDQAAAQAYNIKHGFKADNYIYDSEGRYRDFLSFSGGMMHIVFLMKIDKTTGTVIAAIESFDCTAPFISEFVAFNKPLPQMRFSIETAGTPLFSPPPTALTPLRSYAVENPDSITVSETKYQPAFDGERLFFNDDMDASVYSYRLAPTEDKFIFDGKIKTNESENRHFVSVEDKYFRMFQEDDGVRYIPLTPMLTPDGRLAISYSLPNIFHTDHGTIGYMNESAILFVDPASHEHLGLMPLLHDHSYFHPHFTFYATPTEIIVGCQRMTWPMNYDRDEYEGTSNDPFTDNFYKRPTPIMAAFGIDSWKLEKLFGNLPHHAALSKTGDYFSGYIFDYHRGEAAYSDAVSGSIRIADTTAYDSVKAEYHAYRIPDRMIARPDKSLFYSYDCATAYKSVFCRTITDLKLTDDKIHCIVRYGNNNMHDADGDKYSYISINRSDGTATEKTIPYDNSVKRFACGLLRAGDDGVRPYLIVKGSAGMTVTVFRD